MTQRPVFNCNKATQFIGIYDKNNIEIYKGDNIENSFGIRGKVIYKAEQWSALYVIEPFAKDYDMNKNLYSPIEMNENFNKIRVILKTTKENKC